MGPQRSGPGRWRTTGLETPRDHRPWCGCTGKGGSLPEGADRVRNLIHHFNADGFEALYPEYKSGRPRTFPLPKRRAIKKPHPTARKDTRFGDWAAANNVELAHTPTNSSWPDRVEAQFTALRYVTLDGTDHPSHKQQRSNAATQQRSMIRRHIIWWNKHTVDIRLRTLVPGANVA